MNRFRFLLVSGAGCRHAVRTGGNFGPQITALGRHAARDHGDARQGDPAGVAEPRPMRRGRTRYEKSRVCGGRRLWPRIRSLPDSQWLERTARSAGGRSFGLQLGADSTDVVLLVMNEAACRRLLSDKFSIGADAAAAAGPVGRDAAADTDACCTPRFFPGRARARAVRRRVSGWHGGEHDEGEARKLYGRPLGNREILDGHVSVPEGARILIGEMDRIAPGRP